MDETTLNNIDYAGFFDALQYATDYVNIAPDESVASVVDKLQWTEINKDYLKILKSTLEKDSNLGNTTVISQSHTDGRMSIHATGGSPTDDYIQACAYKTPQGDIYVAYRGTGDGRWGDNAVGYNEQTTPMQEDSRNYFDYVYENFCDNKDIRNLYVTGHSKGGNEAQFVMMTSKYNDRIKACYSIDGQGFSQEAIEYFKEKNENYDELLTRMYSINGEDDFVHQLINPIIPSENTYYVKQIGLNPHDIYSLYSEERIGFLWNRDDDGNIINGKQGVLGEYVNKINAALLIMPEEERERCTRAGMSLVDRTSGSKEYEGMDGTYASWGDMVTFFTMGIFTVTGVCIGYSLELISDKMIEEFTDYTVNILGEPGALFLTFTASIFLQSMHDTVIKDMVTIASEIYNDIVNSFVVAVRHVSGMFDNAENEYRNIMTIILSNIHNVEEWFYRHSSGYVYAQANSYIEMNTDTMKDYSLRLKRLKKQSEDLDWNMNRLYLQLGINWNMIPDLARLLIAGIGLDYADRLGKCADYLTATAEDFEYTEYRLSNEL